MKKILLIIAAQLVCGMMQAQFVYDYLKAADNYFTKKDYASAANYYEKYFAGEKTGKKEEYKPYAPQQVAKKTSSSIDNREQGLYHLAESYRMLNYPSKAGPYYKQVIELDKVNFPLAQYHYAETLRAQAKYEEAEQEFRSFLDSYTTADSYHENAERELQNLQYIQEQLKKKDLKYYTVTKAPPALNTTGASYAPVWLNDTSLLFTSTRPLDTSATKKEYTNRLYQAAYTNDELQHITMTALAQSKNVHQGVVAITPDGNMLFLTRWSVTGNKKASSLYTSTKNKEGWSEPTPLNDLVNTPGANTQQPFVTPDGKYLLYASDRAGGQGGFDIWYSELSNGQPGTPVNMGAPVNTSFDEQAPFYHAASGSLVYSSNGGIGMGGYDLFQSKGYIGNWSEPVNFGYPVNSVKDDLYFTSRGTEKNILENVLLSSDRNAACCLELYYLKKIRPLRQLSGTVVSCDAAKPLSTAKIVITDPVSKKVIHEQAINADGTYSFAIEDYQPVQLQASADGFISGSQQGTVPADKEADAFRYPPLCLLPEPPKVNETFVVNNIYYDFDKATVKPESYPALDEIVRMMNTYPALVIELSAYTDTKGSALYNQKLSEARAKNIVEYLTGKGIDPARLRAKGYGEERPVAPNQNEDGSDNPEGREKNRRTEFKVIK
jgi:OmpA-OmpF porin, OOP family